MKVLCFGSANIDYLYELEHFVLPGETISSKNLTKNSGGKGLNQSIALAQAGVSVEHAGCVGRDDGDFLLYTLHSYAVGTKHILKVDCPSGHAIIQVTSQGENSIILYTGANHMLSEEQIDTVLSDFSSGDFCILQNEINGIESILRKAAKKNLRIVLNPSPFSPEILNLPLELVEYLFLNEVEASQLTGLDSLSAIESDLCRRFPHTKIVLTLGKQGSVFLHGSVREVCGIFDVPTVDTTAAGDTFTGFFIASVLREKPISHCLQVASAAAALAVCKKGAAQSIPTWNEVEMFCLHHQPTAFASQESI